MLLSLNGFKRILNEHNADEEKYSNSLLSTKDTKSKCVMTTTASEYESQSSLRINHFMR